MIASSAVTAVKIPEGIAGNAIVGHMRERYGVRISGGYKDLAGKIIRLGHMGASAHPTHLAALLAVLERTLADLGMRVTLGAAVGALGEWP